MKYLLVVALGLFLIQSLPGQVKKVSKDEIYTQTTVVVKEDTANDLDILNSQFDLDEFNMDQIIRIETGKDFSNTALTAEVSVAETSLPEQEVNAMPEQTLSLQVITSSSSVKQEKNAAEDRALDSGAYAKRERSGLYRSTKEYKHPNRRFKKKKRSRTSGKLHCFKF